MEGVLQIKLAGSVAKLKNSELEILQALGNYSFNFNNIVKILSL